MKKRRSKRRLESQYLNTNQNILSLKGSKTRDAAAYCEHRYFHDDVQSFTMEQKIESQQITGENSE